MLETNDSAARRIIKNIKTQKSKFWENLREKQALRLFRLASQKVPAYRNFLRKNRINPGKIKTFKDFKLVPPTSKKDYLRNYPLHELSWDGHLNKPLVYTSTSGSTGEPFYFPRSEQLDWESSIIHQIFLENGFRGAKGPTLIIIGFGMGVWIGGLITYKAFEIAGHRENYPISIITPGINKAEIFKSFKNLSPNYKQTILIGYPPFIKDIIDEAVDAGINLKKLNLRLLFAAEGFTEKFRDHLAKKTGVKNLFLDTLNVYGTADIGTTGYETPIAILMKRLALKNKELFKNIFSNINKTPTLAQYNPYFLTIESSRGDILFSGNNAIPLIRYEIGDRGGTLSFREITDKFENFGIDLAKEARLVGINSYIYELPFVYVYERADFSTKLYGAIIYAEEIREALQNNKLKKHITGKFTMLTRVDDNHNQFLEINIELKPKIKDTKKLKGDSINLIVKNLLKKNAEYKNNYTSIPGKVIPRVIFWSYGQGDYFVGGGKQKWVKIIDKTWTK